jgi:hypothetical protein
VVCEDFLSKIKVGPAVHNHPVQLENFFFSERLGQRHSAQLYYFIAKRNLDLKSFVSTRNTWYVKIF